MSPLLFFYLIGEMLAPLFATLVILSGVLFFGKLIPFLDVVLSFQVGLADFIRLCAYLAPSIFLFALPMATMLAITLALTRMVQDREVMALTASGVGLAKIAPAAAVVATAAALLTAYVANGLVPPGHLAMKKLLFHLAKEKVDKGLREKSFSQSTKNVVLYMDGIDKKNNELVGIYISDLRDSENPITVSARRGSITTVPESLAIVLRLQDGTLHRQQADAVQTINFATYTLTLSAEQPEMVGGKKTTRIGKNEMTLGELRAAAAERGPRTPAGASYAIEFHQRLALPAGCLILGLLGIPLALRAGIGGRSAGITAGLLLFIAYYVLSAAAEAFGEDGAIPAGPLMWAPNGIFAILTAWLWHQAASRGLVIREWPASRLRQLAARLLRRKG